MIGWLKRLLGPLPESADIIRLPPGDGWHHWLSSPPPRDAGAIELWRDTWAATAIWSRDRIPREMNAWGLYWRHPGV